MAKLAAILFVVQAALVAFSVGASAAPVARDQFGNVLCISSAHGGHGDSDGKGHDGRLDCCRLGCSPVGDRFVPPAAVSFHVPHRDAGRLVAIPLEDAAEPFGRLGEKRARAPPFAA